MEPLTHNNPNLTSVARYGNRVTHWDDVYGLLPEPSVQEVTQKDTV